MHDIDVSSIKNRLEKNRRGNLTYSDLRLQEKKTHTVTFKDYDVHAESVNISGRGLRVLHGGRWGFFSCTGLDLNSSILDSEMEKAKKYSLTEQLKTSRHEYVELAPLSQVYETSVCFPEKNRSIARVDETIELGESVIDHFYNAGKRKLDLVIRTFDDTKLFLSSEGSVIKQQKVYHTVDFIVTVFKQGEEVKGSSSTGQLGTLSRDNFDDLLMKAQETVTNTEDLLGARKPRKEENLTLLFNPTSTWHLFHETVGHALEADLMLEGPSLFKKDVGNLVSRYPITVVDDPTLPTVGSYHFDDDGFKASGTVLIEDGLLVDFLHNRETAGAFKSRSTGNARAQDFSYVPLVRMSNFYIEPGDWSMEELLDFNGLFIVKCGAGLAQPQTGEYRIPVELAYRVKRGGEVVEVLRNFNLSGHMLDFLDRIDAIGSQGENNAVTCVKEGQLVQQGAFCPHIRINDCKVF